VLIPRIVDVSVFGLVLATGALAQPPTAFGWIKKWLVTRGPDSGRQPRRLCLHLRRGGLQSRGIAEAPDGRTTPHGGYAVSQHIRKRIEESHHLTSESLRRK
jgi:hypothetical protein